jgi:2',3'-cyclic-nucleotide 2'-phosphodiesterase (5'-nucleotidase family)
MPGAVLKLALEYGLSGVNTGRFPQVSGLKIFYETVRPKGRQIVAIEVGGKPLDPGKTYRVATVDFLAEGGDGYAMFKNLPRLVTAQNGPRITQVVVDYLRKRRQVRPDLDGRIIAK